MKIYSNLKTNDFKDLKKKIKNDKRIEIKWINQINTTTTNNNRVKIKESEKRDSY